MELSAKIHHILLCTGSAHRSPQLRGTARRGTRVLLLLQLTPLLDEASTDLASQSEVRSSAVHTVGTLARRVHLSSTLCSILLSRSHDSVDDCSLMKSRGKIDSLASAVSFFSPLQSITLAMSTGKRKASGGHAAAPMSVSAGLASSEQAGQPGGAPSTAKRTKIDLDGIDDEDLTGDLDLQEQERKRLQQGRKGRVVTAGYDSDEDSDEEEVDDGEQDGKLAGVDEDDDMFTLEEGGDAEAKTLKKGKRFLELGDIEGQEFAHKGAEEEERDAELELETDEEEYEVDEEEKEALHDADDVVQPLKRKKKSRPKPGDKDDMGFEIDDFNMKNEMASGRFDEEGNYIANAKDPHAEHDKWMTGHYSRKGIKEAKEAKEKREKERKAREKSQDNAHLDEDECMMKLVELMEKGETVLEALQRVGAIVKKAGKKSAKSAGSDKDSLVEQSKHELEQITSLSSMLMSRFGKINIYDETYESILRVVRRSGLVRETWDPAAARGTHSNGHVEQDGRHFTYKWSPAYLAATSQSVGPDVQIFGPYSAQDIKVWFESGYFGDQGERILLKQVAEEEGTAQGWKRWEQVFDLL